KTWAWRRPLCQGGKCLAEVPWFIIVFFTRSQGVSQHDAPRNQSRNGDGVHFPEAPILSRNGDGVHFQEANESSPIMGTEPIFKEHLMFIETAMEAARLGGRILLDNLSGQARRQTTAKLNF